MNGTSHRVDHIASRSVLVCLQKNFLNDFVGVAKDSPGDSVDCRPALLNDLSKVLAHAESLCSNRMP